MIRCRLCPAGGGKKRLVVGLQEANPGMDVASMAQIAINGKFSA
jgi:hypothetical protein